MVIFLIRHILGIYLICNPVVYFTFSALTLLVGWQEGHPACKNEWLDAVMVICLWMRCRLAYSPADAIVTHYLLLQQFQIGFTFLVLPFWYLLTRVVPDRFQQSSKTVVCVCVVLLFWYKLIQVVPDKIQKSRRTIVCVCFSMECV